MDVEGRVRLEHLVDGLQRRGERLDVGVGAVARGVHVREVEYGANPAGTPRDLDHVVEAPEVADAAHHLDPERHDAALALEPRAQLCQLLGHGRDRGPVRASEQEAGMEDDELRARGHRDPGRVIQHPDGHAELLVALEVTHEPRDRRVDGENDPRLARELAELLGPLVVHPEAAREVDLAGVELLLAKQPDGLLGALTGRNFGRAEVKRCHAPTLTVRARLCRDAGSRMMRA